MADEPLGNGRDAADRIRLEGWDQDYRTRQAARQTPAMQERSERLNPLVVETRRGVEQFQHIRETLARVELTDGIEGWALIAALVGVVIGAILWAFGHYSQNYQQAYNGRRGVMVSALAALLIGGAPHIIGFFLGQGTGISA